MLGAHQPLSDTELLQSREVIQQRHPRLQAGATGSDA